MILALNLYVTCCCLHTLLASRGDVCFMSSDHLVGVAVSDIGTRRKGGGGGGRGADAVPALGKLTSLQVLQLSADSG